MKATDPLNSEQWVEFPTQTPKYSVTYPNLPIEHYCDIADRVFISFLKAYRRFYVDGDITMEYHVSILGKRLTEFIQVTMPSHPEYDDKAKNRMHDINTQLSSYMHRFELTNGLIEASILSDDRRDNLEEDDCRDDFESFDDDTDFWANSSKFDSFTRCKCPENESDSTDSLSVTSTAGSFITEIPSVIFEDLTSSSHLSEGNSTERQSKTEDKSQSQRKKESDKNDTSDDVDYSFHSLLSHWKLHERKATEKKSS